MVKNKAAAALSSSRNGRQRAPEQRVSPAMHAAGGNDGGGCGGEESSGARASYHQSPSKPPAGQQQQQNNVPLNQQRRTSNAMQQQHHGQAKHHQQQQNNAPPAARKEKKRFVLEEGSTMMLNMKYVVQKKIGNGSFGEIYAGHDVKSKAQIAVKIEAAGSRPQLLQNEAKVLQVLGNASGVPKFYWYGVEKDYNFLVMERLGPNLEELFNLCSRRFSIKTVLMIADQMIALIEFFHSKNYIHRDVKPDNFLIGTGPNRNKIYIIDYGLSKKFRELKQTSEHIYSRGYVHIPYIEGKSLTGTARYVSINAHEGIEQSRRDDLESICYVLIYFCQGSLPWQGFRGSTKQSKYDQIHLCKKETTLDTLCRSLPPEFSMVLKYCRDLKFDQTPDYTFIRQLFRILLRTLDLNNDRVFDWNLKVNSNQQQPNSNNTTANLGKTTNVPIAGQNKDPIVHAAAKIS